MKNIFLNNNIIKFKRLFNNHSRKAKLYYISEDANWIIYNIGRYLTLNLKRLNLLEGIVSFSDKHIINKIIHYGSKHLVMEGNPIIFPRKENRNVFSWFHVEPNDFKLKKNYLREITEKFEYIHVANSKTEEKLVKIGIPSDKIITVPLGVDTCLFQPSKKEEYINLRKKLGIPNDKFCIGSFQKDGAGWEKGLIPKMIKGPDILCDVLKRLHSKHSIFVLLTGPARGYVKKKLEEEKIPYKHIFLERYSDIVDYYKALDLYLITSREEGGPAAIVESMACGIPLVTTNVGMAEDIIIEGKNGFICKSKKPLDELVEKSEFVLEKLDKNDYKKMAPKLASQYNWTNIARLYYEKMYSKLL